MNKLLVLALGLLIAPCILVSAQATGISDNTLVIASSGQDNDSDNMDREQMMEREQDREHMMERDEMMDHDRDRDREQMHDSDDMDSMHKSKRKEKGDSEGMEMRERQEERIQMMEENKGEKMPDKKPWWKFWESDDDS